MAAGVIVVAVSPAPVAGTLAGVIDESRERSTGGVGLGLAIAQRAVRLHGGEIKAQNCAGQGLR
jgi:light-regulated signal transduction histidine kinase (bacteriophytochrome)